MCSKYDVQVLHAACRLVRDQHCWVREMELMHYVNCTKECSRTNEEQEAAKVQK